MPYTKKQLTDALQSFPDDTPVLIGIRVVPPEGEEEMEVDEEGVATDIYDIDEIETASGTDQETNQPLPNAICFIVDLTGDSSDSDEEEDGNSDDESNKVQ